MPRNRREKTLEKRRTRNLGGNNLLRVVARFFNLLTNLSGATSSSSLPFPPALHLSNHGYQNTALCPEVFGELRSAPPFFQLLPFPLNLPRRKSRLARTKEVSQINENLINLPFLVHSSKNGIPNKSTASLLQVGALDGDEVGGLERTLVCGKNQHFLSNMMVLEMSPAIATCLRVEKVSDRLHNTSFRIVFVIAWEALKGLREANYL